jgi:hypothetical protein
VGETEMQQYFQTLQNRMDIIEEAIVKFSSLESFGFRIILVVNKLKTLVEMFVTKTFPCFSLYHDLTCSKVENYFI